MRIIALAALAALVGSLLVGGSHPAGTAAAFAPGAGAAQQAFLDPVTGQPREPTEAELAALQAAGLAGSSAKAALRPAAAAPEEVHLPDGTVGIRVDQRYYETVVACRQPDGRFGTDCPPAGGKP
jgi:hypothetical protein